MPSSRVATARTYPKSAFRLVASISQKITLVFWGGSGAMLPDETISFSVEIMFFYPVYRVETTLSAFP